ncbi:MAG: flavin reductase family protein [Campylobacterota bacterium]
MILDAKGLSAKDHYHMMASTVIPRPIAWVSTKGGDGSCNLAPFSFFNAVTTDPPLLSICIGNKANGQPKDTLKNLLETQECIVHIIDEEYADAMTGSAEALPYGECEIQKLGLSTQKAKTVDIDMIEGAKVAYECRLYKHDTIGNKPMNIVFVEILCYHIIDKAYDNGRVDEAIIKALGRLGGKNYVKFAPENIFQKQDSR